MARWCGYLHRWYTHLGSIQSVPPLVHQSFAHSRYQSLTAIPKCRPRKSAVDLSAHVYPSHYRLPSGMCHIGLAMQSMSLVAWDAAISIYLAGTFIWPLLHTIKSSRLKRLAIKSLIASIVSCVTSVTNISVLILTDGEASWLCLSRECPTYYCLASADIVLVCTIDVLVNILCLAALTSPSEENQQNSTARALNSRTSKGTRDVKFGTSSSFGERPSHIVS